MSKWLVIGSSATAPEFYRHVMEHDAPDVTITTNAGILLEPQPTFYLVHDPVSCTQFAAERERARKGGTIVVKSCWSGESLESRMRQLKFDVAIRSNRSRYKYTRRPDVFTPGRYLSCGASGALCLQYAVNNGASSVVVVGMEGYNSGPNGVFVETFDGRKGHTRQGDRTRRQYMPFVQSVIDKCPHIKFTWFGVPNVGLRASNLAIYGLEVLSGDDRVSAEQKVAYRQDCISQEAARIESERERRAQLSARRLGHGPRNMKEQSINGYDNGRTAERTGAAGIQRPPDMELNSGQSGGGVQQVETVECAPVACSGAAQQAGAEKQEVTVDLAVKDDIPALVELGHEFHSQSPHASIIPMNEDDLRQFITQMVYDFNIRVLRTQDGTVVGAIGGVDTHTFFNRSCRLYAELFWYVKPEYRRGTGAMRLLRAFEDRARRSKSVATLSSLPSDGGHASKLLERRGYIPAETVFARSF